jgi:lipid A 3-O-deacylase
MKLIRFAALIFLMSCVTVVFAASTGIGGAIGDGTQEIDAWRINLQRTWSDRVLTTNKRQLYGYTELAFTKLKCNREYSYPTNNHLQAYSLSIALRFLTRIVVPVFFDIGIGPAYMSQQQIGSRNLGQNWLFEDRAGIGIVLGKKQKLELGYRFIHYSNAYLAQKNNGLNLHLFSFGYWFG